MSRSDANQLKVPAVPIEPEDKENSKIEAKPESQVSSILDSMDKKSPQAYKVNKCPGCKGSLSEIEQKMGRCITCGKTIEDPQAALDSAPKPTPKFEIRI